MQPADVSMVSTASINQDKTVSASDSFYRGERFEEMIERKYSPQMKLPVATLRLWHTGATMHLSAGALGPESRWDNYVAAFRRTVDLGEEIVDELCRSDPRSSFSVEMGYIDPVFYAASRCRDPWIRRRAIAILKKLPRQEGIWQSTGAAAVAEKWMEVEEEGLEAITSAADVPEHKRVALIETAVNVDQESGRLRFTMSNANIPEAPLRTREEEVRWEKHRSLKDMGEPCNSLRLYWRLTSVVNLGLDKLVEDPDPRKRHWRNSPQALKLEEKHPRATVRTKPRKDTTLQ
jgi:hypothetical protein